MLKSFFCITIFTINITSIYSGLQTIRDTSELFKPFSIAYGKAELQGRRPEMQDCSVIINNFNNEDSLFAAVYDGHGSADNNGYKVAEFLNNNLHDYIANTDEYKKGNIELAFEKAFKTIDKKLEEKDAKNQRENWTDNAGSCAIIALVKGKKLFLANLGDSRAVLVSNDNKDINKFTVDHKPSSESENKRICDAGGYVVYGRVCGQLAVSRAFADFDLKNYLSVIPDVYEIDLDEKYNFLILACDGVWDVLSNNKAAEYVRSVLNSGKKPEEAAKLLVEHAIYLGSGDNVSAVVLQFLWD